METRDTKIKSFKFTKLFIFIGFVLCFSQVFGQNNSSTPIKQYYQSFIFQDNFNRQAGTTIGNDWIYGEGDQPRNDSTQIKDSTLLLNIPKYCRNEILNEVNIQNYQDSNYIVLQYDLRKIQNANTTDCSSQICFREHTTGVWYQDDFLTFNIGNDYFATWNINVQHSLDFSNFHHIKLILDNNTNLYDCYVDDSLYIDDASLSNDGVKIPRYLQITTGSYTNGGQFYYDNISIEACNTLSQTFRSLKLQDATINGVTVTGSAPEFTVNTGDNITGTYNVLFETDYPASNVFPLAVTPNWGDKEGDYWQDQYDMNSGSTYSGTISLTAPSTPGTYYIIISTMSEYTAGQIVSGTYWGYGSLVWDDGNDLFDLTSTQIQNGINTGSITHPEFRSEGTFADQSYGLTAIKLNVGANAIVDNSDEIISIYPNPIHNRLNIVIKENKKSKLTVVNSIGQTVYTDNLNADYNNINISKLKKGVYLFIISDLMGKKVLYKKIIKK